MAEPTLTVGAKVVVPVAGLVWVNAPVILRVKLKLSVPELVIVTAVKLVAFPEPTVLLKLIVPVVFKIRLSAKPPGVPSVIPVTVIAPDPAASVTLAASAMVSPPPMLKGALVVVILLARLADPVVEKYPVDVITPVAFLVKTAELVTSIAPVEVKLLFILKLFPFNVAEPTLTVPVKVVAPMAALVWVRAPVILTVLLKLSGPE